jgi:predicted DNA binding CopG/RHH family protein
MKLPKEQPPRAPGETAHYEDDPFELGAIADADLKVVEDFLPRPEELVYRPKNVKVTITLNEESINFFKDEARRLNVPYQRMIRNLLDGCVARMASTKRNVR